MCIDIVEIWLEIVNGQISARNMSEFSFPGDNFSKCQWIFTKLDDNFSTYQWIFINLVSALH